MGAISWGWRRYAAALITAGLVAIVPNVVQSTAAGAATHNVTFHNLDVLRNIQLVGVDWDGVFPYEGEGVPRDGSGRTMSTFFSQIVNSPYIDALSQYSVLGDTIGRGSFAGWRNLTPQTQRAHADSTQIGNALKGKVDYASTFPNPDLWKANDNTVYVVFMNQKHDWLDNNFCGEHHAFTASSGKVVPFIIIPYLSDRPGCHNDNRFANLTFFLSHEIAETVTDPHFGGWYDGSLMEGEVADLCANGSNVNFDGYNWWWVSQWWSNLAGNCRAVSAK